MKLVYKGKFTKEEQLPTGILPSNAVPFKEPKSLSEVNKLSLIVALPVLFIMAIIVGFSFIIHGRISATFDTGVIFLVLLACIPVFFIHEMLHAVCFGKNSEVELYISPEKLMLFVVSVQPITKTMFIIMCLLPNIVLGWFPLIVWTFMPYNGALSTALFTFAFFQIFTGLGDYLNSYNAFRQMPKGSMQQLSGMHSFWFMP